MADGKLKIATCQFAVGASIRRNAGRIRRFMQQAKQHHADIVHFSECALSGYANVDHLSLRGFDWQTLRSETETIMLLAAKLKLWVVLGSTHPLTHPRKPHNCLYLIDSDGNLIDRYDKRFCMERDLNHYSPGDHFVFFEINGIKCSLLICYDLRFPELYRQLKKKNVQCILQSFYNARQSGPSIHNHIIRQTMQCRAATNHFWISMTNSSAYYAPYPSCFIQPDGKIADRLNFHRPGIMLNTVNTKQCFYDAPGPFRQSAMDGKLHSGRTIKDNRSIKRTVL